MINRVVLVGRMTRDLDLKYTVSGTAVGNFTLAVNRQFTNANGEREADFINCIIWRKSAEHLSNFTQKGSLLAVEGRLQTRNYENQQGQRVYVTEVVVDSFSLLESRQKNDNQPAEESEQQRNQAGVDNVSNAFNRRNVNQQNNNVAADPFAGGQEVGITDDDLPF